MLRRLFTECLVRPGDLRPSRDDLEILGAFNPGAAAVGDDVVLLVRVAEAPRERRAGFTALPRWEPGTGLAVDWAPDADLEFVDPRIVRLRRDGTVRLTFLSHLRVFRSRDGRRIDAEGPRFDPAADTETYGVEDPRVTPIGGAWYFTYVAVSRHGVATALASTTDFERFTRHGILFCPENKDVALFPERVGGDYVALHRPSGVTRFTAPEIWLARSPDLVNWGRHAPLDVGGGAWEADKIGAGPPPLRTPEGWLALYHGVARRSPRDKVGLYSAGALLLEMDRPERVLRRSAGPILAPEADFERRGFVDDVVFPTGLVERDDTLFVYCGGADTVTGVVGLSRKDLLAALM